MILFSEKISPRSENGLFWAAAALILGGIAAGFNDLPQLDVAGRYAPMAEAFAAGDWAYAFHPRVPPLHPTLSGIFVLLTGVSGFTANKIVSVLFFALAALPLFGIFRKLFPPSCRILGMLMYLFCPYMLRLAGSGLRDSGKCFAFLLCAYALLLVWEHSRHFQGYLWGALGAALLVLNKGDCCIYAAAFCLATVGIEYYRSPLCPGAMRKPVAALLLTLVLIAPALYLNYRFTGFPVPDAYFLKAAAWLNGRNIPVSKPATPYFPPSPPLRPNFQLSSEPLPVWVPGWGPVWNPNLWKIPLPMNSTPRSFSLETFELSRGSTLTALPEGKENKPGNAENFFSALMKGFFWPFALPALLGIYLRIRRGEWSFKETILLCAWLGHAVLLIIQLLLWSGEWYLSKRYLLPVAPLSFGWGAYAILFLAAKGKEQIPLSLPRAAKITAGILLGTGFLWYAIKPDLDEYFRPAERFRREAAFALAKAIRDDGAGRNERFPMPFDARFYCSNHRPLVRISHLRQIGYLAGGSTMADEFLPYYLPGTMPDYLIRSSVEKLPDPGAGWSKVKEFYFSGVMLSLWRRERL